MVRCAAIFDCGCMASRRGPLNPVRRRSEWSGCAVGTANSKREDKPHEGAHRCSGASSVTADNSAPQGVGSDTQPMAVLPRVTPQAGGIWCSRSIESRKSLTEEQWMPTNSAVEARPATAPAGMIAAPGLRPHSCANRLRQRASSLAGCF